MQTRTRSNPFLNSKEISRLLTAAVVNGKFCRLLLSDPVRALAVGYNGESFNLTRAERERLYSIRATSLEELSRGLLDNRTPVEQRPSVYAEPFGLFYASVGSD